MTTAVIRPTQSIAGYTSASRKMPFLVQVWMMSRRSLVTMFRDPAAIIPGLILGVFFLVIYEASLGGAAQFFLRGQSYLGFILPLSVISTALSGAGIAGQAVIRDIDSGYFDKLLLTPISRAALLLAPMIAAALVLVLQSSAVVLVGILLGLEPATGWLGVLTLLGYALLIGVALAGLIVGIALRTNSASATSGASFLFFPLTFLTATFTPKELLTGWLKVAAQWNPITYILEACRSLLNIGWEPQVLFTGLWVSLVVCVITFAFAYFSLRARTQRR